MGCRYIKAQFNSTGMYVRVIYWEVLMGKVLNECCM